MPALIDAVFSGRGKKADLAKRILLRCTARGEDELAPKNRQEWTRAEWERWWRSEGSKLSSRTLLSNFDSHFQ